MKKYWFKPKHFGYGFFPITWEGWLSTLVLILLIFMSAYVNGFFSEEVSSKGGFDFLLDVIVICTIFTLLFKDKVRGGLQWHWGWKDNTLDDK